jgi:hypothetical protein
MCAAAHWSCKNALSLPSEDIPEARYETANLSSAFAFSSAIPLAIEHCEAYA